MAEAADATKPLLTTDVAGPAYGSYEDTLKSEDLETGENEGGENKGFFPLEPFRCLPESVQIWIPMTLGKIQSIAHLVLATGMVTCFILFFETIIAWRTQGCRLQYCQTRWLPLVFVWCCWFYFLRTVSQYDENLMKKQKLIQQKKKEIINTYEQTVSDLEDAVAKAMDTQAVFAERSFESKRRDMDHFLHAVAESFKRAGGMADIVQHFRDYLMRWFKVFSECCLEPIDKPLTIVKEEDLGACPDSAAVAELAGRLVKDAHVTFIESKAEEDKKELKIMTETMTGIKKAQKKALRIARRMKNVALSFVGLASGDAEKGEKQDDEEENDGADHRWVHWQPSGFGPSWDPEAEEFYPFQVGLICLSATILSREHLYLIYGLGVGIAIMVLELAVVTVSKIALMIEIGTCLICILFVLYEFVEIDIVQQLELQIMELENAKIKVDNHKEEMLAFYDKAFKLGDVWLHRTVPRLELLKQFCEEVQDVPDSERKALLLEMIQKLDQVEVALPSLIHWLEEDVIPLKNKKHMGEKIMDLTRTSSVKESLEKMPKAIRALAREAEHCLKSEEEQKEEAAILIQSEFRRKSMAKRKSLLKGLQAEKAGLAEVSVASPTPQSANSKAKSTEVKADKAGQAAVSVANSKEKADKQELVAAAGPAAEQHNEPSQKEHLFRWKWEHSDTLMGQQWSRYRSLDETIHCMEGERDKKEQNIQRAVVVQAKEKKGDDSAQGEDADGHKHKDTLNFESIDEAAKTLKSKYPLDHVAKGQAPVDATKNKSSTEAEALRTPSQKHHVFRWTWEQSDSLMGKQWSLYRTLAQTIESMEAERDKKEKNRNRAIVVQAKEKEDGEEDHHIKDDLSFASIDEAVTVMKDKYPLDA